MPTTISPPDGLDERSPEWHFDKFVELAEAKMAVREPLPHLAMFGHMCRGVSVQETAWRLGCYLVPYSLPAGYVTWSAISYTTARDYPDHVVQWVYNNWPSVLRGMRKERRCVYSPKKYSECLLSYADFVANRLPRLVEEVDPNSFSSPAEYYDHVWAELSNVKYFGRYVMIRAVEGLRRFCGVPAELSDLRAMGAWSPRRCLVYLRPDEADALLTDSKECNARTNDIANEVVAQVREHIPKLPFYIFANTLCEYRSYFEDRHQYAGWTIDQEAALVAKVAEVWAGQLDQELFASVRREVFPDVVLGELNGWSGTRWPITTTLRDHGYIWTDFRHDYTKTTDFANPAKR